MNSYHLKKIMTFFPTLPSVNENSEQDVKYLMQNQCLNFLAMDLVC